MQEMSANFVNRVEINVLLAILAIPAISAVTSAEYVTIPTLAYLLERHRWLKKTSFAIFS